MAQNFSELIYKSADQTVGIASGGADRLLGIKPDGLAVVVEIGGNNTVMTKADLRPVASTPVADDTVAYSKKGADDTFFVKSNVEVQSSASVAADDKVYSCKAVRNLIEQTTDGSKWEAVASSSPAAIRPKSNKAVVIGSAGSTSSLTVNGDSALNGGVTVSGVSKLQGNTTIGTGTSAASLSVTGGMDVAGAASLSSTLDVNGHSALNGGVTVSGVSKLQGNTTIGTGTSAASLSVTGGMDVAGAASLSSTLDVAGAASLSSTLDVNGRSALAGGASVGTSSTPSTLVVNGNIAMPTKTLSYDSSTGFTFNDKCTATAFYEASDAKLKGNVVPLTDEAKSKASGIKFVEFDWLSGGHSYGVIAQDVEKVMPELVLESSSKRVNYIALLCAKVAALEDEISQLKSIINGDDKNIG